jgi:hypothetical protein
MTTVNIDGVIARLQRHHTALGDGRDCRSINEHAEWDTARRVTSNVISGLQNAPADLARWETRLAPEHARRVEVIAKQTELKQEIANLPDATTIRDGLAKDKALRWQEHLQLQLKRLHDGTLLRAPGEAYPRLADLDARIAELTQRRDRTQAALDGYIAAAEALLAEADVVASGIR